MGKKELKTLVALDNDQLQLIERLNALLDEMEREGIVLIQENGKERTFAFNSRNVSSWEWDCPRDNRYMENCIADYLTLIRDNFAVDYCYVLEDYAPCVVVDDTND